MGRCPNNKAGGQKKKYSHKAARRTKFLKKGDDMVYAELVRQKENEADALKPREWDEDLPGGGQFYCLHCDQHFSSDAVRTLHLKSKKHKKREKLMAGDRPHNQLDADTAGGLGPPDNGPRLRLDVPVTMAQG
eukprot:TRINITY_DN15939_c0_g1_i1.p1 TRINITY_DN15939_c0_g1~~TRINITY_DN15939_c0_g1_i1.p1  ORF type:complete len:133 (-),score=14.11 TRINITY_DN15939_c0_g1_i1:582-980(-)